MLAATENPALLLVVDDDEDTRVVFRTLLTARGHRVQEARNGREGLAMARSGTPDLIALDLRMPALDGLRVMAALRGDRGRARVPVIVLTAIAETDVHRMAMEAGCDEVLVKPFSPLLLLDRVEELLARSRRHREGRGLTE